MVGTFSKLAESIAKSHPESFEEHCLPERLPLNHEIGGSNAGELLGLESARKWMSGERCEWREFCMRSKYVRSKSSKYA